MRRLLSDRRARAGIIILGTLTVVAGLAPIISPADPYIQRNVLSTRFLAPLAAGPDGLFHLLGTDEFGRDILARLLYGSRISISVALLSVTMSTAIGVVIGLTGGFLGGWWEKTLMSFTDAVLAMPRIVLLLALVALWQPGIVLVVLVLGLTGWMSIARLVRAETKKVKELAFVDAARASGIPGLQLVVKHVLPNVMTPVFAAAALGVGNAIGLEAGLSFLGLGVPPPAPSWGNMIAGGRDALVNAPWIATFPGVAVVVAVVACNLLGDGARDALDPEFRAQPGS